MKNSLSNLPCGGGGGVGLIWFLLTLIVLELPSLLLGLLNFIVLLSLPLALSLSALDDIDNLEDERLLMNEDIEDIDLVFSRERRDEKSEGRFGEVGDEGSGDEDKGLEALSNN